MGLACISEAFLVSAAGRITIPHRNPPCSLLRPRFPTRSVYSVHRRSQSAIYYSQSNCWWTNASSERGRIQIWFSSSTFFNNDLSSADRNHHNIKHPIRRWAFKGKRGEGRSLRELLRHESMQHEGSVRNPSVLRSTTANQTALTTGTTQASWKKSLGIFDARLTDISLECGTKLRYWREILALVHSGFAENLPDTELPTFATGTRLGGDRIDAPRYQNLMSSSMDDNDEDRAHECASVLHKGSASIPSG